MRCKHNQLHIVTAKCTLILSLNGILLHVVKELIQRKHQNEIQNMWIKTFMKLKYFLPQLEEEIKSDSLLALVCMLYLTCDYKKIPNFYKNNYLRETMVVKDIPPLNKILVTLYTIGENKSSFNLNRYTQINEENYTKTFDELSLDDSKNIVNFSMGQKIILEYLEKLVLKNYNIVENTSNKYLISQPTDELIEHINKNGFAVLENFLSSEALAEMRSAVTLIADRELKNKEAYTYGVKQTNQRVYNLLSKDKCFRDFLECSFLEILLEKIFSRDTLHEKYGLSSIAAHIIPNGGEAMLMHIDNAVPEPLPPWRIRFILIICLTDMNVENGAPGVVPCSHLLLKKPSPEEAKAAVNNEKILIAPAGSLLMWDGGLWHRSRTNTTQNNRIGVIVSYAASFFKEICGEEEHLVVVPQDLQQQLSPRLRSLIGLDRGVKSGAMYFERN